MPRPHGFFYQSARGRAMVRNRSIRRARAIKSTMGKWHPDFRTIEEGDTNRRMQINNLVKRARQAHREWRSYRNHWIEFEKEQN